jgi:cytochrome c peroxidase
MGGKSFEKVTRFGNYLADRGDIQEPDNGRYNFTKEESDRHMFKVPILRNIALSWPYLHDGSTSDLAAVVRMMTEYQVDQTMTDAEVDQVVQFLKTLTGEYQGKLLQ